MSAASYQLYVFCNRPGGCAEGLDSEKLETLERIHKEMGELIESLRLQFNGINEEL